MGTRVLQFCLSHPHCLFIMCARGKGSSESVCECAGLSEPLLIAFYVISTDSLKAYLGVCVCFVGIFFKSKRLLQKVKDTSCTCKLALVCDV